MTPETDHFYRSTRNLSFTLFSDKNHLTHSNNFFDSLIRKNKAHKIIRRNNSINYRNRSIDSEITNHLIILITGYFSHQLRERN